MRTALPFSERFVTVGDVDGDGWVDVVASHAYDKPAVDAAGEAGAEKESRKVTVLFGDGSNFSRDVTYEEKVIPNMVHVADPNGDGRAEVMATDPYGAAAVRQLDAEGAPGASDTYTWADVSHPNTWTTGLWDINDDGRLDLFGELFDQALSVRFGDGRGGFGSGFMSPPLDSILGFYGGDKVSPATDFDRDGHLDLLLASACGSAIAYGDGHGAFPRIARLHDDCWETRDPAAIADFNEDGWPDVLGIREIDGVARVVLLLNDGSGVPVLSTTVVTCVDRLWVELAVGDVDGDGHVDAVVSEGQSTFLFLGLGNGAFTAGEVIAVSEARAPSDARELGTSVVGPELFDANGDGNLDLFGSILLIDSAGLRKPAILWLGDGKGHFTDAANYAVASVFGRPVDIDGNGLLDVLARYEDDRVCFLLGQPDALPVCHMSAVGRGEAPVGDLNGDGLSEYAMASGSVAFVYVRNLEGTQSTRFAFAPSASGSFAHGEVPMPGDFDEDGRPDLVSGLDEGVCVILNRFPLESRRP